MMKKKFNYTVLFILSCFLLLRCGSRNENNLKIKLKSEVPLYYDLRIPADYDPAEPPPLVIAFHDQGDDETQVTTIWDDGFYYEPDFILLSARGPFQAKGGYSWIIESDTLLDDWNDRRKASAQVCEKRILDILDGFKKKLKFDEDLIYVMGFSQGARMALHVGLKNSDIFTGISAESGAFDTLMLPVTELPDLEGMDVYLSAGKDEDSTLLQDMKNTDTLLTDAGARVLLNIHEGGYIITPMSCRKMQNFMGLSAEEAPEDNNYQSAPEDTINEEENPE